ncbi:hypothetical protein PLICRDRAFT_37347 [Plicaturopsis crispa FD-325 SS-3]|nr:hypothetical protein PLICRDRAFT_37347 [Plicaturopsis crispa FD-325 SS-3]
MHKRHHAQRQHIISSLDTLLYQLHTLSFLLSPSVWVLIARLCVQFHLPSPRALDTKRTLRFWFGLVLFFNFGALWNHATMGGADEGRAVVLDFVGLAHAPSKAHLLALDGFIVILQWLLTTIAFESSLPPGTPSILDPFPEELLTASPMPSPLLPTSSPRLSPPSTPMLPNKPELGEDPPYIIDLRLPALLARIRSPPELQQPPGTDMSLPLPNTAFAFPTGLRMLARARAEMRRRADQGGNATREAGGDGRVPGAMEAG